MISVAGLCACRTHVNSLGSNGLKLTHDPRLLTPVHVPVTQMLKCIELDERLKAMDQEITVNPQFVQKVSGQGPSWTRRGRRGLSPLEECGLRSRLDVEAPGALGNLDC